MSATIDFQAFTSSSGEFIIKELAILSHQTLRVQHWIFKPPYEESCIDSASRQIKQWLEKNHHGLKWASGNIEYTRLKSILLVAVMHYNTLYVKGREKAQHLKNLLERHVIDLTDLGCPSLKTLPHLQFYCEQHQENKMQCAQQNVYRLAQWCLDNPDVTDMKLYNARLKSFAAFSNVNVKAEDLANTGFYYCYWNDTVACAYCNVELHQWMATDIPREEHKRWSPRCPFINDKTLMQDVCGIY